MMKRIVYLDYNNNQYDVYPNTIKYKPVKPIESSSGVYSGGEYKEAGITDSQFKETSERVLAISDNKDIHLFQRQKLTSRLYWMDDEAEYQVIMGRSDIQADFVMWLKTLLQS